MSHANLIAQAAGHGDTSCSACGLEMQPFFDLPGVPVNSCLLVESREQALKFPRGDIVLAVCPGCGFVRNTAFEPSLTEYSGRYEETQGFSGTFSKFQESLAAELVARHRVQGKTVIEVGCGKGEFLALLCRVGGNRGVGYDPSFDTARRTIDDDLDVRVVREFYGEGSGRGDGDLVCCKMTLEHIPRAAPFARALRAAMRPASGSTLFIQVPESLRILRDCAFEDVYYEHCSYFTPGSLARLFRAADLHVDRLAVTYGNQYLTLEGSLEEPGDEPDHTLPEEETVDAVVQLAAQFASRFEEKVAGWRQRVEDASRLGPVALWGSGSKAVAFLRAVQPVSESIEHVVDINPHRHGFYMPGTGQRILSPAELATVAPRTVIAMNPIYRNEIAADLDRLGVDAELLAL